MMANGNPLLIMLEIERNKKSNQIKANGLPNLICSEPLAPKQHHSL